jgi:hypothetical protein
LNENIFHEKNDIDAYLVKNINNLSSDDGTDRNNNNNLSDSKDKIKTLKVD